MTRHEPRPPSPHIPRVGVTIVDGTNDVDCPVCHERLTLGTDGHGGIVGIDRRNRVHRHDVSMGPGERT